MFPYDRSDRLTKHSVTETILESETIIWKPGLCLLFHRLRVPTYPCQDSKAIVWFVFEIPPCLFHQHTNSVPSTENTAILQIFHPAYRKEWREKGTRGETGFAYVLFGTELSGSWLLNERKRRWNEAIFTLNCTSFTVASIYSLREVK